jgi:hypothetical protein
MWRSAVLATALFLWTPALRASDEAKPAAAEETAKEKSSASPPPAAAQPAGWRFGGSLRARVERWDWFNPGTPSLGKQNEYAFLASYLRFTALHSSRRADIFAEVSIPILLGLP